MNHGRSIIGIYYFIRDGLSRYTLTYFHYHKAECHVCVVHCTLSKDFPIIAVLLECFASS